jgi:hypothetical protein
MHEYYEHPPLIIPNFNLTIPYSSGTEEFCNRLRNITKEEVKLAIHGIKLGYSLIPIKLNKLLLLAMSVLASVNKTFIV